jgi:hypothetical protein
MGMYASLRGNCSVQQKAIARLLSRFGDDGKVLFSFLAELSKLTLVYGARRRKRYAENNRDYLNNQMNPVTNINTTYYDRCKDEISSYLRKRVDEMFIFSEKEAEEQKDVRLSIQCILEINLLFLSLIYRSWILFLAQQTIC